MGTAQGLRFDYASDLVVLVATRLSGSNTEKLDRVYVCAQCKAIFLFKSDVQDHNAKSCHEEYMEWEL
jgi:hypothetical protein